MLHPSAVAERRHMAERRLGLLQRRGRLPAMKGLYMKALPVEPSNVPVAIGSRIRAARQSQRLTIEQVADATGLTKGFLSRVERDLTSPSVASLVTLCQVLSISIGDLFAAPETHLTKRDAGPRISLGGEGIVERLLTARSERRLQIIQAVIEPRG